MKTYEIKHEPVTVNKLKKDKYNIYYYENEELVNKEFHSTDGVNGVIKEGYVLKK